MFRKISKRHWTLIFLTILFILFCIFILPISIPLILAFITALMLNPLIRLSQKWIKVSRKVAVILVFLLFLVVISLAGTFVVTKAIAQVVNFVEEVPTYASKVNELYNSWEDNFKQYASNLPDEIVMQVSNSIENSIIKFNENVEEKFKIERIAKIFSAIPQYVIQYIISFIVYLIALFLFMLELPILKAKAYNMLTKESAKKVSFMTNRITNVIIGFFKAQFLVSLIIFAVSLIGLLLIAPDVALLMSLIIWLIDLIPIIGSIAVLGPWSVIMFLVGDFAMGIQLAILAIILLAIRRTVEPKVMGKHIGLSPLATLIAMFLGLQIIGVLGFILGPLIVIAFNSAKEAEIIKWNIKI